MLLSRTGCDVELFPIDHRTAIERTHYTGSTKLFALVDRPFWTDVDPETGRDVMSMTLSDRMTRGTYLLDQGPGKPGLVCLSYTWSDDSLKSWRSNIVVAPQKYYLKDTIYIANTALVKLSSDTRTFQITASA